MIMAVISKIIAFFRLILGHIQAFHARQTGSAIWYCKNNICRCYNTIQSKFYFKPPKCPKCRKLMKNKI